MRGDNAGLNNRGVAVLRMWAAAFSFFSQTLKLCLQILELVVREVFQIDKLIARAFHGAN
jgi:hypothetical protein